MADLTRMEWWTAVHDILGYWPNMVELTRLECAPDTMFKFGLSPVEAAAAIAVAEFSRSLNA